MLRISANRPLAWSASAAAILAALLVVVHLPQVQVRVLAWGLARLRPAFGLDVGLRRGSYNLLTRSAQLEGVTVEAAGGLAAPFASAERLFVKVSWATLLGRIGIDALEADGLQVTIVRGADGSANLPRPPATSFGAVAATGRPVGRVSLRHAGISFKDIGRNLDLRVGGVDLTLDPAGGGVISGRLVAAEPPSLHVDEIAFPGTRFEGAVRYDGTSIVIDDLVFDSREVQLRIAARVESLWSAPRVEAQASGTLGLSQLSSTFAVTPAVQGTMRLRATVAGPLGAPVTSIAIEGDGVSWRHLGPAAVRAQATLTPTTLRVDEARLALGGGTLDVTGRYSLSAATGEIQAAWAGVPASLVLGPWVPAPVSARLSGAAELTGSLAQGWPALRGRVENRSLSAPSTRAATTVDGRIVATLTSGRWHLVHEHLVSGAMRVAGEMSAELSRDVPGSSRLSGVIAVSAANLSRLAPLLRTMGIAIPEPMQPRGGELAARFTCGGTVAAPELSGTAALTGVRLDGVAPLQADVSIVVSPAVLSLAPVRVSVGGNLITGSARLDIRSRAVRADLEIDAGDLAALAGTAPESWRPGGSLLGRVQIAGSLPRPTVRVQIAGADLRVADQRLDALSALVGYEDGVWAVRDLDVRQAEGGQFVAEGTYAPGAGRYEVAARATALSLGHVAGGLEGWPIAAVLDGQFRGEGTLAQPAGAGSVAFARLDWGSVSLGPAVANLTLADGLAVLSADLRDLSTHVAASLRLRAPRTFEIVVDASNIDVSRLANRATVSRPSVAASATGHVNARISASGDLNNLVDASVDATLQRLDLGLGDAALQLIRPAGARYQNRGLEIDALQLRSGSTVVEASGALGPAGALPLSALHASLRGSLSDLAPWLAAVGVVTHADISGAVTADLTASGSVEQPTLTGRVAIENGNVATPGYPDVTGVTAAASLSGGVIDVTTLEARWGEATAEGRVTLPLGLLSAWLPRALTAASPPSSEAVLAGVVRGLTAASVTPFIGKEIADSIEGSVSVAVDLRSDALALDRVSGAVTLTDLQLSAGRVPVTQVRPTRFAIAGGRAAVADWTWDAAGNRLTVAGQAVLGGDWTLDFRATGQIDLRLVRAFAPDWATGGIAQVSLNVGGSVRSPLATGTVDVRGGELRIADPQIAASGIDGQVVFDGASVRIRELSGSLNGGRFAASGEVRHEGLRLVDGAIVLSATDIALNAPFGIRSGVDAALALSVSGDRTRLSGTVTVQRGSYRQPLSLAAGFVAAARRRGGVTSGEGSARSLDWLELDVAIVSAEDLVVDNNYGRMEAGLDLRLVGTLAQPSVVGRAAIREGGTMYLGGRAYQIESGTIDFTNPRAVVPDLDLTARTRISGYDITLGLRGAPDAIRTTLSSDPPLAQTDIVSLLATGRLADELGGAGGQAARDQALGLLSGEALGLAGRAVGLDTLRLESGSAFDQMLGDPSIIAGEVDPVSRLTVSKRFSRYVEVVLSQNLREEGRFTWIVAYTPREDIELRSISRDDRSRSYEARHNVAFGGTTKTVRSAASTPEVVRDERIAAVRFAGAAGLAEPELRRLLQLGPGDRYDFYRWQQDRERLRGFLLGRGYLEARVSARRTTDSSPPHGGTVLEYGLDRGPLVRIRVEGFPLPSGVLGELEGIWANGVFDEARIADLDRRVRVHMVEDGFLRPGVDVSMRQAAPEAEKLIRIVVAPGPRTRVRDIQFEGNREVSRERLDGLVAAAGPAVVWLEPAGLVRHVRALYQLEGFLAATAVAEPVRFAGETAALSVRIEEGPRFLLSDVSIVGAVARPAATVRQACGLKAGDPYSPDALDRAQRAVEADYAREGFTAANVSVAADANRSNATVRVIVTVDEGPRQVIDRVIVPSVPAVRQQVIADALRLQPGTAVDMEEWYRARRRLLDTGLFRRVDIEAAPSDRGAGWAAGDVAIDARVSMDREPVWRLLYGVNVSAEPAPTSDGRTFAGGLSADLRRRGLFGRAGSFGGTLRAGRDQQIGRAYAFLPSFFGRPVGSNLFVSRSHERIEATGFLAFVTNKTTVAAEQRVRIARSVQLSYGYEFERNHTFDPHRDPDDPFGLDLAVNAARLTSTTAIDTRDVPFDAGRGLFHSSNIEYAPASLGSDVRFAKYFMQQFVYVPVGTAVVSASAVRLGLARGFGQDLIPSERYFAGGGSTVRGFASNSLGDTNAFGESRGGQAMVLLNQELRFPVHRWLRGVAFVDAGNVFDRARDLSLTRLAVGAGAGLRLSTPLGLFRLDFGVPLSEPGDRRSGRWHFSFGQMF